MHKKSVPEFNQQFATLRLREPINEGRVMFTIDDQQIDDLFLNTFEADVDYIHDGPDVYYVTDQNELEKFVDYIESKGLDGDAIQVQEYFKEEGSVTGGESYAAAMDVPSKKQNPFKEDSLSGYKELKGFKPGHTPDRGGFQYKELWEESTYPSQELTTTTSTNKEELDRVEALLADANANNNYSVMSSYENRIKRLKLLVWAERKLGKQLPKLPFGMDFSEYLKKELGYTGPVKYSHLGGLKNAQEIADYIINSQTQPTRQLTGDLDQDWMGENLDGRIKHLNEINKIVDEVFSPEDYRKVLQIIQKIKYTNTKLYNAILDMISDIYPHDYSEIEDQIALSENYNRFKNETKTRTKPEQFHQAVKSVKRKVEEIHKLYEYMERLKMELSESSDGLKYKKYTENAMQKIKEAVKALHIKTKKLK